MSTSGSYYHPYFQGQQPSTSQSSPIKDINIPIPNPSDGINPQSTLKNPDGAGASGRHITGGEIEDDQDQDDDDDDYVDPYLHSGKQPQTQTNTSHIHRDQSNGQSASKNPRVDGAPAPRMTTIGYGGGAGAGGGRPRDFIWSYFKGWSPSIVIQSLY
jgi:hypothetical protein